MIVTLAANTDYLKRIKEVVADANDGITQPELDSASEAAEDDIQLALIAIGFDSATVLAFTSTGNTPHNVIEAIKLLSSARVWARMLLMYRNEVAFEETLGATFLEMANQIIEGIAKSRMMITQAGVIINASGTNAGKGSMKFNSSKLGIGPNMQAVPDADINRFINEHGPNLETRNQQNPYNRL